MSQEEISIDELFNKFKKYKIDIKLEFLDSEYLNIDSYNKDYIALLITIFNNSFDLILEEEKDTILYQCIDTYDILDIKGFVGGYFIIKLNCEKNDMLDFFSNL